MEGDPASREPGFFDDKDALQDQRGERCREIFETYGLPTPERVGEDAAGDFWVLVQHDDRHPDFQASVLKAIQALPEGTFDSREEALLVDRVRINTGRLQVYGSQTDYDMETGRAFPKPLEDPAEVDARRAAVGLDPLWVYMNGMCELQFMMNEALFAEKGIQDAWAYPAGFTDW